MDWFLDIFEGYTSERKALLKSNWFTLPSWYRRLTVSTRPKEISRLIGIEAELNTNWMSNIRSSLSKLDDKELAISTALLTIDTHIKKQNNRSFYLVLIGALLAGAFKILGVDLSVLLVGFAFLLAGERLVVHETVSALEELKIMIERYDKT